MSYISSHYGSQDKKPSFKTSSEGVDTTVLPRGIVDIYNTVPGEIMSVDQAEQYLTLKLLLNQYSTKSDLEKFGSHIDPDVDRDGPALLKAQEDRILRLAQLQSELEALKLVPQTAPENDKIRALKEQVADAEIDSAVKDGKDREALRRLFNLRSELEQVQREANHEQQAKLTGMHAEASRLKREVELAASTTDETRKRLALHAIWKEKIEVAKFVNEKVLDYVLAARNNDGSRIRSREEEMAELESSHGYATAIQLKGIAGQGKTAAMHAAGKRVAEICGLNFVDTPGSDYKVSPRDFMVVPLNVAGAQTPMLFGGMPSAKEHSLVGDLNNTKVQQTLFNRSLADMRWAHGSMLLVDDVTTAAPAVLSAIQVMFESGNKLGDLDLGNTVIVDGSNFGKGIDGSHAHQSSVTVKSRQKALLVIGTVEGFLKNNPKAYDVGIASYLMQHPERLNSVPEEGGAMTCPRTLSAVVQAIHDYSFLRPDDILGGTEFVTTCLQGSIDASTARELEQFLYTYSSGVMPLMNELFEMPAVMDAKQVAALFKTVETGKPVTVQRNDARNVLTGDVSAADAAVNLALSSPEMAQKMWFKLNHEGIESDRVYPSLHKDGGQSLKEFKSKLVVPKDFKNQPPSTVDFELMAGGLADRASLWLKAFEERGQICYEAFSQTKSSTDSESKTKNVVTEGSHSALVNEFRRSASEAAARLGGRWIAQQMRASNVQKTQEKYLSELNKHLCALGGKVTPMLAAVGSQEGVGDFLHALDREITEALGLAEYQINVSDKLASGMMFSLNILKEDARFSLAQDAFLEHFRALTTSFSTHQAASHADMLAATQFSHGDTLAAIAAQQGTDKTTTRKRSLGS